MIFFNPSFSFKMTILLNQNKIILLGEITENLAFSFRQLFQLAVITNDPIIELHISSDGGDVNAANSIMDIIQLSYKPVHAFIHNTHFQTGITGVASAASVIVTYCTKIFIDHDASFLIHHARNNSRGIIKQDVEDVLFWMQKTDLDFDTISYLLNSEKNMNANEAICYGFVDEIIKTNSIDTIIIEALEETENKRSIFAN